VLRATSRASWLLSSLGRGGWAEGRRSRQCIPRAVQAVHPPRGPGGARPGDTADRTTDRLRDLGIGAAAAGLGPVGVEEDAGAGLGQGGHGAAPHPGLEVGAFFGGEGDVMLMTGHGRLREKNVCSLSPVCHNHPELCHIRRDAPLSSAPSRHSEPGGAKNPPAKPVRRRAQRDEPERLRWRASASRGDSSGLRPLRMTVRGGLRMTVGQTRRSLRILGCIH
jgi:hypothetical protein